MRNLFLILLSISVFNSTGQMTGSTPYIAQFGINQVENDSGANWQITNADENDMVIAIVDDSDEVVAHAFIKSKEYYMFKNLPIGNYSYKFSAAGDYFESKRITKFTGCDPAVYICEGDSEWTMEVWVERSSLVGKTGEISKDEFFN